MISARLIPCLLLSNTGLVKTRGFGSPSYVGDPINTARIFCEMEVDEIIVLDIDATVDAKEPNYELISEIASECFMPMAYGGGVKSMEQIKRLIRSGVEKIVINSAANECADIVRNASNIYGSQAIVVGIDIKKDLDGCYEIYTHSGSKKSFRSLFSYIDELIDCGVGELFINDIDRDGSMEGMDLDLIKNISQYTNVPVIACGGAGCLEDINSAINDAGASAVAAGSLFVFYDKSRSVLLNYPQNLARYGNIY